MTSTEKRSVRRAYEALLERDVYPTCSAGCEHEEHTERALLYRAHKLAMLRSHRTFNADLGDLRQAAGISR